MTLAKLLHGTKVRLTALTEDDVATMIRWYQDTEFLRLYDSRPAYPKTEAELARWLEELQKDRNTFALSFCNVTADVTTWFYTACCAMNGNRRQTSRHGSIRPAAP
jgi:RimJ/RimL family protein N-acetyltransferase